jgi:hypothetical protein
MDNNLVLPEIFNKGMGVKDALLFGQKVAQDKQLFHDVLHFAVHETGKPADKAAWVIYKAVLECECDFAQEFQHVMMEDLTTREVSPAVRRELVKVLLQLHPEEHEKFGLLFDCAKEWMFEVQAEAAVRYSSLNVIELAGKKFPELIPECWEIIQEAKELAEGPWQRRCKKVQEDLNRRYLKWTNKKG